MSTTLQAWSRTSNRYPSPRPRARTPSKPEPRIDPTRGRPDRGRVSDDLRSELRGGVDLLFVAALHSEAPGPGVAARGSFPDRGSSPGARGRGAGPAKRGSPSAEPGLIGRTSKVLLAETRGRRRRGLDSVSRLNSWTLDTQSVLELASSPCVEWDVSLSQSRLSLTGIAGGAEVSNDV